MQICRKLKKKVIDVTIYRHGNVTLFFSFWHWSVSLVKFSYWFKIHVNIMTGSGVMTNSVYKELNRSPGIGNTPIWISPNIWRLGRVRDTKFGTNISNKKLLNTAKCHCYSFNRFWVIKGKPTGAGNKITPT